MQSLTDNWSKKQTNKKNVQKKLFRNKTNININI